MEKQKSKKTKISTVSQKETKSKSAQIRSQKGNKRQNPKSRIHSKIQCKLCLFCKLYANYKLKKVIKARDYILIPSLCLHNSYTMSLNNRVCTVLEEINCRNFKLEGFPNTNSKSTPMNFHIAQI